MARPIKEGLDYFPLDTDIIHDIKIRKIMRSNGPQSIAVLLDLLGNIYGDHGYYMQWDDDVRFLVADDVGISEAAVDELVSKAIQVDFFDEKLFKKYSILTSKGIQKRYQKASKRKSGFCIQKPYNLIVNVHNNPPQGEVNDDNNPTASEVSDAESTRKESKVNKSKENNNIDGGENPLDLWTTLWGFPNAVAMSDFSDWREEFGNDLMLYVIKYAAQSNVQAKGALRYLERVFDGWRQQGIKTVEEAKRATEEHNQRMANARGATGRTNIHEELPGWAQDEPEPEPEPEYTPEQLAVQKMVAEQVEIDKERERNG